MAATTKKPSLPIVPDAKPARQAKRPKETLQTAESMAGQQKDISISEFFAKNRHLLGFDNPRKAMLTTVKEAVDNSLDACEEAGILPEIWVIIEPIASNQRRPADGSPETPLFEQADGEEGQKSVASMSQISRFRITVRDNGPGIVKAQVPNVFGKLLYGSKFHRLRMSRGQQGIGISAAGMYGLLTTGQSVLIVSRTAASKPAHRMELQIDTRKNRPEVITDEEVPSWMVDGRELEHGTEVAITLEAKFQRGRASVDEYLEQTAIANPHATVHYTAPDGEVRHFAREVLEAPAQPRTIKPHPYGVELGVLIRMLKEKQEGKDKLGEFMQEEFCRVTPKVAEEICERAGLSMNSYCARIAREEADRLHHAINQTKILPPPTDCLVPIGVQQILKGLLKEIKAEFYSAETREPAVYRGNPFQIEVGLAYGGQLPADEPARIIRFANRVPLLYQPSACVITKSVIDTNWRNYRVQQSRVSIPVGPLVVFVHMASVWVPFTSESKEAIADYDEIRKEIRLAIQTCGRKLATYLNKKDRVRREGERRSIFERYIGEVAKACAEILGLPPEPIYNDLMAVSKKRTATADVQLGEDGKPVAEVIEDPRYDPGTIIVDSLAAVGPAPEAPSPEPAAAPVAAEPAPASRRAPRQKGLFDEDAA